MGLSSSKTRSFALVNPLHFKVPLNCYGSTAVERQERSETHSIRHSEP